MIHLSGITLDRSLFATKGDARPTPDFVPRLKTEEPARIEPASAEAVPLPEARVVAGDEGELAGLITRRVPPAPPTPAILEARRAAEQAEREAERLARTVSEQVDNGMLYESLSMGLPMPDFTHAKTDTDGHGGAPATFEEAARAHISRPFDLSDAGAQRKPRKRRKLTVRLGLDDFDRFKAHADDSGRTYQDIIATATLAYLDEVASPHPPAKVAALAGLLRALAGLFRLDRRR
jgi:hypothetical protein